MLQSAVVFVNSVHLLSAFKFLSLPITLRMGMGFIILIGHVPPSFWKRKISRHTIFIKKIIFNGRLLLLPGFLVTLCCSYAFQPWLVATTASTDMLQLRAMTWNSEYLFINIHLQMFIFISTLDAWLCLVCGTHLSVSPAISGGGDPSLNCSSSVSSSLSSLRWV